NRSRIDLERARVAGTRELFKDLPNGAVYREGTPDCWREIQMPPAPRTTVIGKAAVWRRRDRAQTRVRDMKLDKAEITRIIRVLDEEDPPSDAVVAMASFLSSLRRQMDDHDVAEITAAIR